MKEFSFSLKWLPPPMTDRQRARFYETLFWLVTLANLGPPTLFWVIRHV